jgi:hypothetical protein
MIVNSTFSVMTLLLAPEPSFTVIDIVVEPVERPMGVSERPVEVRDIFASGINLGLEEANVKLSLNSLNPVSASNKSKLMLVTLPANGTGGVMLIFAI